MLYKKKFFNNLKKESNYFKSKEKVPFITISSSSSDSNLDSSNIHIKNLKHSLPKFNYHSLSPSNFELNKVKILSGSINFSRNFMPINFTPNIPQNSLSKSFENYSLKRKNMELYDITLAKRQKKKSESFNDKKYKKKNIYENKFENINKFLNDDKKSSEIKIGQFITPKKNIIDNNYFIINKDNLKKRDRINNLNVNYNGKNLNDLFEKIEVKKNKENNNNKISNKNIININNI